MQFTAEHTNNQAEHKLLIMHLVSQDERLIFSSNKSTNKQTRYIQICTLTLAFHTLMKYKR
jgi:hypothetical protein